jgi:thiol:disulfide interchange protein
MAAPEAARGVLTVRDIRKLFNTAWKRREPVFWVLLVALAVGTQWPMLRGWYYRATGSPDPADGIVWRTNLSSALGEAKMQHKLVLVDFSANWCPPCLAMRHDVWPDSRVAKMVGAGFVAVKVDIDKNGSLSDFYNVPAIPTVLVLDPQGRVVRRHDGFLPLDGMLQFLGDKAAD